MRLHLWASNVYLVPFGVYPSGYGAVSGKGIGRVDPSTWATLQANAWRELQLGNDETAFDELKAATGVDFCDVPSPYSLDRPPTPATRDIGSMVGSLPRRLRKAALNMLADGDSCGAMEVLDLVHDAAVEADIIGYSKLPQYLLSIRVGWFGHSVVQFLLELHRHISGCEHHHRSVAANWLSDWHQCHSTNLSVRIAEANCEAGRGTPLHVRPAVTSNAPPTALRSKAAA